MTGRTLLVLPLACLGLVRAGCGAPAREDGVASAGGATAAPTASSSASSSASAPTDPREAQLKFAQCMREHGVEMDDPEPGGGIRIRSRAGDGQKVEQAQQACKHFMEAAIGDGSRKPGKEQLDRGLKFAQCMREHGIDMPDPAADGRIEVRIKPGTPEEKVNAAHEACKEFQPGGGPA
jgi:hypothetical protein